MNSSRLSWSHLKRGSSPIVFVLFFLANPAYLTSCSEKETFEFGEREMNILLDDVGSHSWQADGYTIELELQPEGAATARLAPRSTFIDQAAACERRTLVAGAAACMATTEMTVSGNIWVLDGEGEMVAELTATGSLFVTGYQVTNAELQLQFDEGTAWLSWYESYESGFILREFQATGLGAENVSIDYEHQSDE